MSTSLFEFSVFYLYFLFGNLGATKKFQFTTKFVFFFEDLVFFHVSFIASVVSGF